MSGVLRNNWRGHLLNATRLNSYFWPDALFLTGWMSETFKHSVHSKWWSGIFVKLKVETRENMMEFISLKCAEREYIWLFVYFKKWFCKGAALLMIGHFYLKVFQNGWIHNGVSLKILFCFNLFGPPLIPSGLNSSPKVINIGSPSSWAKPNQGFSMYKKQKKTNEQRFWRGGEGVV